MITITECLCSFLDLTAIIWKGCICVCESSVSISFFGVESVLLVASVFLLNNKEAFEKIKT